VGEFITTVAEIMGSGEEWGSSNIYPNSGDIVNAA